MKLLILITVLLGISNFSVANEQIIGNIGLTVGTVKNQNGDVLKAGDPVYFGDQIVVDDQSKSQVLLLDETVLTLGQKSSITIDEFIYDPSSNSGKIVTNVISGSLKVLSGKVSQGNPEDLVVKTAAGTIGTRGTEFQTIVNDGESKVLLIGPGENNTLGLRPGAVEVSNDLGSVILDSPFAFTQFATNQIPTTPVEISNEQLQEFQNFLEATSEALDEETVAEAIKEGLFDDNQVTGNEIIGEILTDALNLSDGGLTFGEIATLLGTSVDQLLGEDLTEEFENESEGNQIAMANAEGGDGLAYILRYGGTDLGPSTYGDFQGITSGTYTYTANGINMAATKGTGSGTFNGVTTVNFANQTIANTFSGSLSLDGNDEVNFSYSYTTDYSSGSASSTLSSQGNFNIDSSTGATTQSVKGSHEAFDPTDYTSAAGAYHSDALSSFFNVQMNGSPNSSTGSVATIALNVTDYNDTATDTENTIDGQRVGIMPKRN